MFSSQHPSVKNTRCLRSNKIEESDRLIIGIEEGFECYVNNNCLEQSKMYMSLDSKKTFIISAINVILIQ